MLRALARMQTQYLLSIAKLYLETRAYAASFVTQAVLLYPMVKTFGVVGMAISSLMSTFVLVAIQSLMLRLRDGVSMASLLPHHRVGAGGVGGGVAAVEVVMGTGTSPFIKLASPQLPARARG